MFKNLFRKKKSGADLSFTHNPYQPVRSDRQNVERSFSRLFASDDGRSVLNHLQIITYHRALGATATDEQLRHLEGQRSLVSTILRLIERGRGL